MVAEHELLNCSEFVLTSQPKQLNLVEIVRDLGWLAEKADKVRAVSFC